MSALQLAAVVLGDRRQYGRLLLRELRDVLASCQRTINAHVSVTCSYAAAARCHPRGTCALSPVGSIERGRPLVPTFLFPIHSRRARGVKARVRTRGEVSSWRYIIRTSW